MNHNRIWILWSFNQGPYFINNLHKILGMEKIEVQAGHHIWKHKLKWHPPPLGSWTLSINWLSWWSGLWELLKYRPSPRGGKVSLTSPKGLLYPTRVDRHEKELFNRIFSGHHLLVVKAKIQEFLNQVSTKFCDLWSIYTIANYFLCVGKRYKIWFSEWFWGWRYLQMLRIFLVPSKW